MITEKGGIKLRADSLEHHPLKSIVRLNHSRLRGVPLHMLYLGKGRKCDHHTVIHHNRVGLVRTYRIEITDLDMRTESDYFIAYFTLESNHNGYGNDHHRQTNGNTNHGNHNGRTGNLFSTIRITINPTSKKIRKPQFPLRSGRGN